MTEYGLQAGIFSSGLQVVYKACRELEVGGGVVSREGRRYAIRKQTEPKLLALNLDYRPSA